MHVTLDTNILARAIFSSGGPARRVLEEITLPPHALVLFEAILDELGRVMKYPRLRALHGFEDAQIQQAVDDLRVAGLVVDPVALHQPAPVITDPDDEVIIGTALSANVEVLCTLDKHLRQTHVIDYCRQHGIRVLTDVELLQELQGTADV